MAGYLRVQQGLHCIHCIVVVISKDNYKSGAVLDLIAI